MLFTKIIKFVDDWFFKYTYWEGVDMKPKKKRVGGC